MIEIKHLRTLQYLRETGSLTGAAERLHLTQSALSHQIKVIEHYFNLPLFERKSRPLRLTAAGERLMQLASRILPEIEQVERELRHQAKGRGGRLHVVIECHSCYEWLLPVMDSYRQDWPEVELDLPGSVSFQALDALREGRVDLVITSDPVLESKLTWIPFARFEILLALPFRHPLADKPFILPQDLAMETVITYPVKPERLDIFRYFLKPAGVRPQAWRTSELTLMILELVKSGRGVSALPAWALATALKAGLIAARPLGVSGLYATLYLATRAGEADRAYLAAFIEAVQRQATQIFS